MKCESCGQQLRFGNVFSRKGYEIEYSECDCGFFEVEYQKYDPKENEDLLE
jgi:hypothetical protein